MDRCGEWMVGSACGLVPRRRSSLASGTTRTSRSSRARLGARPRRAAPSSRSTPTTRCASPPPSGWRRRRPRRSRPNGVREPSTGMAAFLALVAACAFALGNAMQQRGALRTSARGESSRFLLQLFRRPVWILGEALQIAGFVAQVVALAIGSLLVVQAIVVSSFVIALPCGVWLTDQRLGRREVLGALTTVTGLILFLVGGHSTGSTNHATAAGWVDRKSVVEGK